MCVAHLELVGTAQKLVLVGTCIGGLHVGPLELPEHACEPTPRGRLPKQAHGKGRLPACEAEVHQKLA